MILILLMDATSSPVNETSVSEVLSFKPLEINNAKATMLMNNTILMISRVRTAIVCVCATR